MQMFFDMIWHMSIQGVVVFVIVMAFRFLLKKLHISHKYITVLWMILFFYLVFPWKLELPIGFWNEEVISSWSFTREETEPFGEVNIWNAENGVIENTKLEDVCNGAIEEGGLENAWNQQTMVDINPDDEMVQTYLLEENNAQFAKNATIREYLAQVIHYIWIVGACVLFVHFIYSYVTIHRKLVLCQTEDDNICFVQDIYTPMVFGFIKPHIYLPVGMETEGMNYVLAHEKMHIKRGDHIIKIIAYFICILHWFNPLVWISYRLLGDDIEKACDEAVVRNLGEDKRKDYAKALLLVAEGNATKGKRVFAAPICFDEGNVKSRIKNIIKYKYTLPVVGGIVLVVALALGIILLTKSDDGTTVGNEIGAQENVDAQEENSENENAVLQEDVLSGLDEQNEEPAYIEGEVMIRENFQDLLGYDGYYITEKDSIPMITKYYAVEGDKTFIIAESWGWEREDYYCDVDGDGVRELICNVCWGDGVQHALIYRRFEDGIRVASGSSLMDEEYDNVGAGSLQSSYDITNNEVVISYWKEESQCYNTKTYELDLETITEWRRPDIPENGDYTLKVLYLYDDNLSIEVAAIGKELGDYDLYGVKEVDIYINDSLSQTLVMQEAIEKDGIPMVEEGYTRCPKSIAEDHLINTVDINFDGYLDLQVFAWNTKDDDIYYYYCWNPNESKFEYAFCLNTPEIDTENQLLITYNIVSRYEMYHYKYYKVNEDNTLELIKTVEAPVVDTGY